jgi:hypothetical protein
MTAETDVQSLRALALEARAAVEAATEASKDANVDRLLVRLREEVDGFRDDVAEAAFCLRCAELAVTAEERAALGTALQSGRDALTAFAARVASGSDNPREDRAWKTLKDAVTELKRVSGEVRESAVQRFVGTLPTPEPGLLVLLPPDDSRRTRYGRLTERYRELVVDVTTDEAARTLRKVASELGTVAAEIEATGVPAEHRAEWTVLIAGSLTLDALSPGFAAWLAEREYSARVVLTFR